MDFLEAFHQLSEGNECPEAYLTWSALSAIAVAAGRKFYILQGRNEIRPNLYLCLIGKQGNRKSTAKDIARDLVSEALADYPIGADLASRDEIIRFMSSKDTCRFYLDHTGSETEWHPLFLSVDELKHFLSYHPESMISFIVEVFNKKHFKGATIKRGTEEIIEPCLNILACETPEWIVDKLKLGLITGGFGRRFIMINEPRNTEKVRPWPYLPADAKELWQGMKDHLLRLHTMKGCEVTIAADARAYFEEWYKANKADQANIDPMLAGFLYTKDQQVLKVAMLKELSKPHPTYEINLDTLQWTFAEFAKVEPNLPALFVAAGRNELAVPQHNLLELIKTTKNGICKADLMAFTERELDPMEQEMVLRHLIKSGRCVESDVVLAGAGKVKWIATKDQHAAIMKNGGKFLL